jgi:ABC-type bacteriocin/lantibiotic exporter with double-glycine peptidase domain
MSVIIAVITLLSGILSLVAWWVKRKRAPTKEERIDDANHENTDSQEALRKLREEKQDGKAEEMLVRMRKRAATGWVRHKSTTTSVPPGPTG